MKILLGGGSGFIGTALRESLKKNGHLVTNISRRAGPDTLTWDNLKTDGLPSEVDAVVNLAGENVFKPFSMWNDAFKKSLSSSRVDTTKLLADAITKAANPPKVFVSSSAVGFYKPDLTAIYTEESPGGDFDFMSKLCSDWEAASTITEEKNVRNIIIRIGLVMGRQGGTLQRIYLPFFMGLGGQLSTGNQWFPWVHINDITGLFQHAIQNQTVHGVLNGVAPNPVTNKEFTESFAGALNRPAFFRIPAFAINCLFGSERAKIMLEGQHVLPEKTLQTGYVFQFPDINSACKDLCS